MAVDRRLVKLVNSVIVEHVFWLVNADAEEEATQPCALLVLGRARILFGSRENSKSACPGRTVEGKMLVNCAESPPSAVRIVRQPSALSLTLGLKE